MSALTKLSGRLRGGLSSIADWLRLKVFVVKPSDLVYAVIGGVVGAGVGLLFVAMWNR